MRDANTIVTQGQEDQLEKKMSWSFAERRRRMRNYRLMFKVALVFCAFGVVSTAFTGAYALGGGDTRLFMFSVVAAIFGAASAWLTLDSTVGIIELDTKDGIAEQ